MFPAACSNERDLDSADTCRVLLQHRVSSARPAPRETGAAALAPACQNSGMDGAGSPSAGRRVAWRRTGGRQVHARKSAGRRSLRPGLLGSKQLATRPSSGVLRAGLRLAPRAQLPSSHPLPRCSNRPALAFAASLRAVGNRAWLSQTVYCPGQVRTERRQARARPEVTKCRTPSAAAHNPASQPYSTG